MAAANGDACEDCSEMVTEATDEWLAVIQRVVDERTERLCLARVAALEAGVTVTVQPGYEIDLPPDSGPWRLASDGRVMACQG